MTTRSLLACVGVTGLAAAAHAASPPRYRVQLVDELIQDPWHSGGPSAISSGNVVVGGVQINGGVGRGWSWDGNAVRYLLPPSGMEHWTTAAYGVNSHSLTAGAVWLENLSHAALWSASSTTPTLLSPLGPDQYTQAFDVNDSGVAVGTGGGLGIVWRDGVPQAIGPLAGGTHSILFKINNAETFAGYSRVNNEWRPSRWVDGVGTLLALPALPQGAVWDLHSVTDMNEHGDVIGFSGGGVRSRSHLWRNGEVIDLAPWDPQNPSLVIPGAINDLGWIVGYQEGAVSLYGTFLWIDGQMTLLSDLLEGEYADIELLTMNAISNDGVIAGTAWINGRQAPVFLMPIPAPGATTALVTLTGLAALRRRPR